MAIELSDTRNGESFESQHHVHFETADDQHVWTLTGIVKLQKQHLRGSGRDWGHEDFLIGVTVPGIPSDHMLKLKHWAPHLTLNAISNDGEANYAGWAIDGFRIDNPQVGIWGLVNVRTRLAVRDVDGWIHRLSYVINLAGAISDTKA